MTTTIKTITADEMLAVINNPKAKENIGLFITTESARVITAVTIKTAGINSGLPNNKVTVNDKPLYLVCDNTTGEAWTEETESKFKAYAYLGMFEEGEKFHCKCTTCGMPINEVYHDYDNTLCEDCFQLEYPKQKDWKKACKAEPDECYYTEYTDEGGDDMEFIVVVDDSKSEIDRIELIPYNQDGDEYETISIIDVPSATVPKEVLDWLYENEPYTYMDNIQNEHMYCDIEEWYLHQGGADPEHIGSQMLKDVAYTWTNEFEEKYPSSIWDTPDAGGYFETIEKFVESKLTEQC